VKASFQFHQSPRIIFDHDPEHYRLWSVASSKYPHYGISDIRSVYEDRGRMLFGPEGVTRYLFQAFAFI
jgi:hypothetical protein